MGSVGAQRIGGGSTAQTEYGVIRNTVNLNDQPSQELRDRIDQLIAGDEPVGSFWGRDSELINLYGQLQEADNDENNAFNFSKGMLNAAHQYYRYYNDGDVPGWANYYNGYRGSTVIYPRNGGRPYDQAFLTPAGEQELERRVVTAVAKEYKRYKKSRKEW